MLQVECSCNEAGYVFLDDIMEDYYSICKKCGRRIYGLNCPQCKSGFAIPEEDKQIDKLEMSWKCDICGQTNKISPMSQNNAVKFYRFEEVPKGIEKEKMGKNLWEALSLKKKIFFIFIITFILFIYFIL